MVGLVAFYTQSGDSLLAGETQQVAEATQLDAPSRKLVSISHANPEDNEFVSWLATRLVASGYEVWADTCRNP